MVFCFFEVPVDVTKQGSAGFQLLPSSDRDYSSGGNWILGLIGWVLVVGPIGVANSRENLVQESCSNKTELSRLGYDYGRIGISYFV